MAQTWRPRELAPPLATPSWGGPIGYWIAALRGNQSILDALGAELTAAEAAGVALDAVIYVQPVSGPLDVWQRLAFLRWHLDRHAAQVAQLQSDTRYPAPRSAD